jgi:hypothetical protein
MSLVCANSDILVFFNSRLVRSSPESPLLWRSQTVLEALQKERLIPKRAKQRLDSTHVLSAVRDMSALECVRETLRLGLEGRGFGSSVSLPYPILLSDSFICGLF